jgi:hypothetical protein
LADLARFRGSHEVSKLTEGEGHYRTFRYPRAKFSILQ